MFVYIFFSLRNPGILEFFVQHESGLYQSDGKLQANTGQQFDVKNISSLQIDMMVKVMFEEERRPDKVREQNLGAGGLFTLTT